MDSPHHAGDPAADPTTGNGAARVADLLAEGRAAFDKDQYQTAIEAWSRIFLIDADHEEAGRCIDEARRQQAEQERRIEEIFHDAVVRQEAGDTEQARSAFARVLSLQPNHTAAREHLRRLDANDDDRMAVPARTLPPSSGAQVSSPHPAPRSRPAQSSDPGSTSRRRTLGRAFLWIGSAVLLLAATIGWLLYSQRQQLFPNARTADEPAATTATTPIAAAERLQVRGDIADAIEMLERVPPESADYAQAQTLIAQWQNGRDPILESIDRDLARHADLLAQAGEAYQNGDPLTAHRLLAEAATIAPPTERAAALEAAVDERLEPVADVLEMYRDGAWEFALPRLWRIHEARPDDPIVERLLIDGYYNLAVRDLQRNAAGEALDKIAEAVELAPEDPSLERVAAFARAYQQRPVDLRYRLFVKYLPLR